MLFVIPALAANFLAVALMASKKRSPRVAKTLYNEKGEMDSWTGATKFQTDLIKNLVENGLIANMNVEEVKTNYPAFKGFSNACLSNKLSNLKRTFNKNVDKRGKMEEQGGGGMDLKAYANIYEKCGMTDADVCDEKDDEDWELVGNEEDDLTFATTSIAYKSKAGGGAASKVTFAKGTKDVSAAAPPAILRREQNRGASSFTGGEICQWIQDKWFGGGAPAKRLSICLATVGECTVRVATDQRHLVVEKSLETEFYDAVENLAYVFPRFAEAYNSPAMADEVFTMLMENHPRFLARKKTEEKLKKSHGSNVTDRLPQECRIPLECKCRFDFVRKEEDRFFYGMESVSGPRGYTYIHVELMGETDGFSSDEEAYKPTTHHQMASPIPQSVNIKASSNMSVSSACPPSVNINIDNNHNINNSNRSSGNSVSSRRTSYSTTSKASSKGKFAKYVPGLQSVQGGDDDASSIGTHGSMAVDTVAESNADFSTPQAGEDADWWNAVAQAEKEMVQDMHNAKIHIDTKQHANDDGDKKPAAKKTTAATYDGASPRSKPNKQKKTIPSTVSVAGDSVAATSQRSTRSAAKRKPTKQDESSVAAASL